ncbi:flavin-binding monooxygenase [Cadophora sp. DSE1049]|nr:flavin-binding monooxygenase [Cadophora sp. DSE1049]
MGSINQTTFKLREHTIENFRPSKVRIIGAGYSGIYLGIRITQKLRNIDLQIYEKNEGVGGTWWENRYPKTHSYQYSFEPNPSWSSFYAPALEIRHYLENVAGKYGIMRFVRTRHQITQKYTVESLANGEVIEDETDILIVATGPLNKIKWPKVNGLGSLKGALMHSAAWDENYDFQNKRVGIIGGGSSSIQIVPQLQKIQGAQLACFVRTRTWISNPFGEVAMQKLGLDPTNLDFTPEFRGKLASDPAAYLEFRKTIERDGSLFYHATLRNSEMQTMSRGMFTEMMRARLGKKPEIAYKLMPSFAPGCRRLTPGPGYLEALVEDNVEFITDEIDCVTEQGLRLASGREVPLDALVCATGFDLSASASFNAIGKDEVVLATKSQPYLKTYLRCTTDDFPNYFMMLGPNSGGDYIVKCIRKLQKKDYVAMVPKKSRVQEVADFVDEYFKRTVFTDDCNCWYKVGRGEGQRVIALWPGSTQHCLEALRSPRWEDFDFESGEDNRLRWLGNGISTANVPGGSDPAFYVDPGYVDTPPPGNPEDDPKYKMRPFSY